MLDRDKLTGLALPIATVFADDFRVEAALAAGGMGAVYRVHQVSTDKPRALKVMLPRLVADVDLRRRFVQEARIGSRIDSEHVVEVHSAGLDVRTQLPYLVMELLSGVDLGSHARSRAPLSAAETREVLAGVFHAIGAAHSVGIVHRDIKPENIFLAQSRRADAKTIVKMLDFGIAKIVAGASTLETDALGTPVWMAPEQARRGSISAAADCWALGLLTFYLLTGKLFWSEGSFENLSFGQLTRELLIDPIPAASERAAEHGVAERLPARFDAWFARCATRDVTSRFPEAREQWNALEEILQAATGGTTPRSTAPAAPKPFQQSPLAGTQTPDIFANADTFAGPRLNEPPLIGRDGIIESLRTAALDAMNGAVRVVLVTGAPGHGRSRILSELSHLLRALGFSNTLRTTCSTQRQSAFHPMLSLVAGNAALQRVEDAFFRALSADVVPVSNGFEAKLDSIATELFAASRPEPLALVIDDVQAADPQTLMLLRVILERAANHAFARLYVVVAVRDERHPHQALTDLLRQADPNANKAVTRLSVPALSDEAARRLLDAVAPVSPVVVDSLLRGAAGVPFFLVQPLTTWIESGKLTWANGAWTPTFPTLLSEVPPGVVDFVRSRLDSLFGRGTSDLAIAERALAAVGLAGRIAVPTLKHVLKTQGIDDITGAQVVDALVGESAFLRVGGLAGEYEFQQPFVRRAAQETFEGYPWFPRIYRALLDALADSKEGRPEAAFLAHGYRVLGAFVEARQWFGVAYHQAFGTGAFQEAARMSEQRIGLTADATEAATIGLDTSEALLASGELDEAARRQSAIQWAGVSDTAVSLRNRILLVSLGLAHGTREQRDPTLVADCDAYGNARMSVEARISAASVVRTHGGIALLRDAEEILMRSPASDVADLRYRARALTLEILYEARVPPHEWRAAASLARAAARDAGSIWAELDSEADLAVMEAEAGNTEEAITILTRVARRAEEHHLATVMRNALNNIAGCYHLANRADEVIASAKTAERVARQAGSWRHLAPALALLANALLEKGLLAEARAAIDESIEIQFRVSSPHLGIALMRRAEILRRSGDRVSARRDAQAALERAVSEEEAMRIRTWLALDVARDGDAESRKQLHDRIALWQPKLERSPEGRKLLDAARALLGIGKSD